MEFLRHFTPNWFTVGMGTGIVAITAYLYPGGRPWMTGVGTAIWIFNTVLVGTLLLLIMARWVINWHGLVTILQNPVQSMFLGAIPMAVTTVVNGFVDMGPALIGHLAISIALWLWMANVLLAVVSGIAVPFFMFVSHTHTVDKLTGLWLMPVVPAEVTAASVGTLIPHIAGLDAERSLMVVGLGLWAFSVPLAFLMLGFLFLRLALYRLPPAEMAISTWISLGTLGTGIMGLIDIGRILPRMVGPIGFTMEGAAVMISFALWGFGLWWLALSVLTTLYTARRHLPFNLGWWGLTFPLGVFTGGTDLLYDQLHVPVLAWIAHALFLLLVGFFVLVLARTLVELLTGRLSFSGTLRQSSAVTPRGVAGPSRPPLRVDPTRRSLLVRKKRRL